MPGQHDPAVASALQNLVEVARSSNIILTNVENNIKELSTEVKKLASDVTELDTTQRLLQLRVETMESNKKRADDFTGKIYMLIIGSLVTGLFVAIAALVKITH